MVMASAEESRLVAVMLPIDTAGTGTEAGSPALSRWRVSQPAPTLCWPGVPSSMVFCASKWLRVTGGGMPAATTAARWPDWYRLYSPDARGCRPQRPPVLGRASRAPVPLVGMRVPPLAAVARFCS